jgi:CBS domain-containing protein
LQARTGPRIAGAARSAEIQVFAQAVRNIMERRKLLTAPPHTTVLEAATMMAKKRVGAVLIVEDGRLLGIFTERDAVFRVIARRLDPASTPLADVMTREPKTISPDKSFGHAMLLMHENQCRHLPVVENGKPVGIVSSRNALDPDLEEFVAEERRRKHIEATR